MRKPWRHSRTSAMRLTGKARADIAGKIGDYHTDCPLDNFLVDWKGVKYADVPRNH